MNAMKSKAGGRQRLRRAAAVAGPVAAALAGSATAALLVTACGVVHVHFGSAPSSAPAIPAAVRANIAYAQCMRTHGYSGQLPVSPGSSDSSAAKANTTCKHLLPSGGTATATPAP